MKVFIFVFVLFMPTILVADYVLGTISDNNNVYSLYRKDKDYYIKRHADNVIWYFFEPDSFSANLAELCDKPKISCLSYDQFLYQICPAKIREAKGLHILCSFLGNTLFDNSQRHLHETAPRY
ncbi:MAG: hypothetical protein KZQ66_11515 [Candidatus Thiodiazotropha sp. (ex Lucinoma aequizonata)]|nr:hypothetical protein [Candidatus Thiodiazotropha sp. (ex Lucinoma aequizonata)]MCU7893558.1 hypothetical protein [Candidatus Thiodiazotropha sp. (ex Lucinoma aequizonata)]MCU7897478.1 hypothetical protein [Candidatus Thiodiazotropha sp. (ex Lucinoma aequizonata)]MCU7902540.1 hypothetical protein [Candidatus Thiodiazotropha sp. (ex Lucinoma aequizonata)]MCU7907284.1 hypothetical protein [Candidatus Thiodiazotropha sp. (ex Lucinoma aequizonata)]